MKDDEVFFVSRCLACGEETIRDTTTLTFNYKITGARSGVEIRVHEVPVARCPACGEEYVPGEIGVYISDFVDRAAKLHEGLDAGEVRRASEGGGHLEPTSMDFGWTSVVPA